ncbi:MAG: ATP-binding protein [Oscillospiraceae bacterium]|nr:ATP-binding protein [Oscillospiraceae bacterium]
MKKKALLVAANLLIIVAMVVFVLFFSISLRTQSKESAKKDFRDTIAVMGQISSSYLAMSQHVCDDWALFINTRQCTMEQGMAFLTDMNAEEDASIQLLRASDLTGISSATRPTDPADRSVAYTEKYGTLYDDLQAFAAGKTAAGDISVTRNYTNPIDSSFVVAFCSHVTLYEQSGQPYDGLLLRLEPRDKIAKRWAFPVGYDGAQIGLIDGNGDYILRPTMLKSENFYEFIRAYNALTYQESYALRDGVTATERGGFSYLDAAGTNTYFAYAHVSGNEKWVLVGSIPESSLGTAETQWQLLAVTCGCFVLLLLIDGQYFSDMNRRLTDSLLEAEKANKAKTNFLSTMSHDIRTPMNAIIGMTAVAEQNLDDREQVEDCLKKTRLASNQLLTLINDILDISKVESGKLALNPSVFSLPRAAQELVGIMYAQIRSKQLRFDFHAVNVRDEYVFADALRINQIWINILSNAVKYTNSGGSVLVTLKEEEIPADAARVKLIFTVADTGIGMSKEFLGTIFEPFTRAADSRTDGVEGSGLGMAITKQMVDLLGGTIDVTSEQGKGSTFTVAMELPRAKAPDKDKQFPGARILLAGSDGVSVLAAAQALAAMQADADCADDAAKARQKAAAAAAAGRPYDAVIMDERLWSEQTARGIRAAAGGAKLILASYDPPQAAHLLAAAGADGSIMLPVFRSTLAEKLDAVLNDTRADVQAKPAVAFGDLHILVAEDNDLNWEILQKSLAHYGIATTRAENGRVCVELLEQAPGGTYQLIFMDVHMPVMDGYEATREIRMLRDAAKASVPIVAMTADAFAEDVEACLRAGMNAHIAKPVNMEEVLKTIEKQTGKGIDKG